MIFEQDADKFNNRLVASAFVAWLTTDTKKKKFSDYLKVLGLSEKEEPLNEEQKKILKKRTDELAAKIIEADKQRKL